MPTTHPMPLLRLIEDAKSMFLLRYGFHAERLHASTKFAHTIQRWARKKGARFGQEIEIAGLQVLHSTRVSAMMDFYLSATRGNEVHSLHLALEPDEMESVGVRSLILPGESDLTFDAGATEMEEDD